MVNVETLGALERRLNASISRQQLRGEVEARLKRLGRTAKIHGFRPGKVPFKILEQQYGMQVQQEALDETLYRAFAEAAKAHSLKVAGNPEFEIKKDDPAAEQIEYSATFEVYPEVVLGDIAAQTVVRASYALNDTDVNNTIATLRKQRAVFEISQQAAQKDDQVYIDFSGKLNGVVFEGGEATNFKVLLGAGRMLPDFENAIIGLRAGETKSFDLTFPADYHDSNMASKQVTFTITLHKIETPRLPELDTEFAKSMGVKDGDVNRLKAEIRANLAREIDRRLKVRNKDSAMQALLKISTLEAPKALVNFEARTLMQQMLRDMEQRGAKIPEGMSLPPDMFTERAQQRVKLGLILAELVKQHQLQARPEQIKTLVQEYAQSFDHPEEVVKWHYGDPSRLRKVEDLVLEDNVVAWVMSQARVSDQAIAFNDLMEKE
ncbi:MAG: trigger factor [Gallionellaceae bacterium]|nr:trigger factor [Gallionellaceae bacterium]